MAIFFHFLIEFIVIFKHEFSCFEVMNLKCEYAIVITAWKHIPRISAVYVYSVGVWNIGNIAKIMIRTNQFSVT